MCSFLNYFHILSMNNKYIFLSRGEIPASELIMTRLLDAKWINFTNKIGKYEYFHHWTGKIKTYARSCV